MFTSWPDMKSTVNGWFQRDENDEFDGLSISITPYLKSIKKYFEHATEYITSDEMSEVKYLDGLALHHVRGSGATWKHSSSEFYWSEWDGEIEYMIVCPWLPIQNRHSLCTATFLIPELEAEAKVDFNFDQLPQWREIIDASIDFFNNGLIGSN